MSRFYSNLHIQDVEREDLFRELVDIYGGREETVDDIELESPDDVQFLGRSGPDDVRFFLAPSINDWTTIFTERVTMAEELARQLSGRLDTWGIYLWTDPQKAWGYVVFENGQMVDEFVSNLEYYDPDANDQPDDHLSGNPDTFSKLLEEPTQLEEMIQMLEEARDHGQQNKNLEPERIGNEFSMFCQSIGIPHAASDYTYIAQGDSRNLMRFDDFVHFSF